MNSEQDKQIEQLSMIEQSTNTLLAQRQEFTAQANETQSAMDQLRGKTSAYKIIGNIMVATRAEDLIKELTRKKELLALRIKTLQKQEEQLKAKAKTIQESVMSKMKK
ncbi:MAG: prefoldin subunit [archaeon]